MVRCYSCFAENEDDFTVCSKCGCRRITEAQQPIYLEPGTLLNNGRYLIGKVIGEGGFGIVYVAWDYTLKTTVAIKEFYAHKQMTRAIGCKSPIIPQKHEWEVNIRKMRFLSEARNLIMLNDQENWVHALEHFEENNTAYIVMEHLKGMDLKDYIAQFKNGIDIDLAIFITLEAAKALMALHKKGIIDRDVAPDNIFLTSGRSGLQVKMIDIGSAWLQDETDSVLEQVVKFGFSPSEQYDKENKKIGPWMDVYALGATLYMMLTGKVPDESTNRRMEDQLTDVKELNSAVSDQLNNTVMKAMAINRQMRFQTVEEFVNALNGNRKVVTLKKERRLRRMRWTGGILAACLALTIVGGYSMHLFSQKRAEGFLKPAELSVWYSVEENSDEGAAMEAVREDFQTAYPDVTLILRGIPAEQYQQQLEKAARENKLPSLFESSGASGKILEKCNDLEQVRASEQFQNCLFLTQYDQYYHRNRQIPLAIEVPMAYIITGGASVIDYDGTYFTGLEAFGAGVNLSADDRYEAMVRKNFGARLFADRQEFLEPLENTSPVLLSSTMTMNEVRQNLTNYEKAYAFYQAEKIYCNFIYEWSICTDDKNETAAAERLLSWMLGNVYQTTLMITECNDGQIPVNPRCFRTKIEARNLKPISEIYKNFVFEREEGMK